MADVLREFIVSLAFRADRSSQEAAKRSVKDYEKTVVEAEEAIEAARYASAKTAEQLANLDRQRNLRLAREDLERAKQKERAETEAANKAEERRRRMMLGLSALAAAAIVAAKTTTQAAVQMANGLENLYYSSQRTKASATNLKAFAFAASQLGSSTESAVGSLETMQEKMRSAPGYESIFNVLGVQTRKANGDLRDSAEYVADLGDALAKMPIHQAKAYGNALGIDEKLLLALRSGEFKKGLNEYRDLVAKVGLDQDAAAKKGVAFSNAWRKMEAVIELVATKVQVSLMDRLGGSISKFTDWLTKNAQRIAEGAVKIVEFFSRFLNGVDRLIAGFDKLSPKTQDFITKAAALAAALMLFKAGPIGALLALAGGIVTLIEDYERWQSGARDTLVDWGKWGPQIENAVRGLQELWDKFDAVTKKLTGEDGLTAAFAAFGVVLAAKVLGPLTGIVLRLGWLAGFRLPVWLLKMLGIGGVATVAAGAAAGAVSIGAQQTAEQYKESLRTDPDAKAFDDERKAQGGSLKRWWQRTMPTWLGGSDADDAGGQEGTRRRRGRHRLKTGEAGIAYEATSLKQALGIGDAQWSAYREGLTDIEGKSYSQVGGSSGRYSGRYQFGPNEIAQTARQLGETPPSRAQFLADKDMQERYMERYTLEHHNYLMRNSSAYRDLSAAKRLEILGYAHNQGAGRGGALTYLESGRVGADAFGTRGTAYFGPIRRRLAAIPAGAPATAPATSGVGIDRAIPKIEGALQNFNDRFSDSMEGASRSRTGAPLGTSSNTFNNSTRSNTLTNSPTTNITINGATDPKASGEVVKQEWKRQHSELLNNLQGNFA